MDKLNISTEGVNVTQKEIVTAVVAAVVWGVTYLFIRRYMNPATRATYMSFKDDAIYGALAVLVAMIAKNVIGELLVANQLY